MTPIAPYITAFLRDHLVGQRGASEHTRDSYAFSFQLLFTFASQELRRAPSDLSLEDIDALLVARFLEYLETTRNNTRATRNVRLGAIKSFCRFLEYRDPRHSIRSAESSRFRSRRRNLASSLISPSMKHRQFSTRRIRGLAVGYVIAPCSISQSRPVSVCLRSSDCRWMI